MSKNVCNKNFRSYLEIVRFSNLNNFEFVEFEKGLAVVQPIQFSREALNHLYGCEHCRHVRGIKTHIIPHASRRCLCLLVLVAVAGAVACWACHGAVWCPSPSGPGLLVFLVSVYVSGLSGLPLPIP